MAKNKTITVHNKKDKEDIILRIDKLTGRLPLSTRVGYDFKDKKKYNRKIKHKKKYINEYKTI